jgi:hypothetical protein
MSTLRWTRPDQAASRCAGWPPRGGLERAGVAKVENLTALSSDNGMRELFAAAAGLERLCGHRLHGDAREHDLRVPLEDRRRLAAAADPSVPDARRRRPRVRWADAALVAAERVAAPRWTAASWREWIVRCVHLRGDQHTEIVRKPARGAGGAIDYLKPHHPDNVRRPRRVPIATRYDVFDPENADLRRRPGRHAALLGFGFDGCAASASSSTPRATHRQRARRERLHGPQLGEGAMPKIALTYPNKLTRTRRSCCARASSPPTAGPARKSCRWC